MVIAQYEKSKTIYFTLRAYSRDKFELEKIDSRPSKRLEIRGQWESSTAGGCANFPLTHKLNPKFKLTITNKRNQNHCIAIELRGPKVYQVGFEVTQMTGVDPFEKVSSGNYRSGYCALEILNIPTGTYIIVPSTFEPGQTGPFFLSIKSHEEVKLEKLTT